MGFTHGFQPWPYRIQYWRGGKKIADKITVPRTLTETHHAPFDREIGYFGNLRRKGSRNSVIRLAANFFEKKCSLSEQISRLLFLFREAGNPLAHFDIRTIALCSLFEGTTNLIFDELKLENELRRTNPQFEYYIQLRNRFVGRLRRISSHKNNTTLQRLAGSLSSAKEFRVKDKFQAACEFFKLDYEKEMKPHFEAWIERETPLCMEIGWSKIRIFRIRLLLLEQSMFWY